MATGTSYESGYDPKRGYNKHAFENPPPQLVVLGKTVRLLAAPIGLISEAIHNYKDKRSGRADSVEGTGDAAAAPKGADSPSSPPAYVNLPAEEADALVASGQAVPAEEGTEATHELVPVDEAEKDVDGDEADWALDDATAEVEQETDLATLEQIGYGRALGGSSKTTSGTANLPFPVIIPQRRPGTKTRGFVRAYAPVLQDAGIDRNLFLTFLKDLHSHAQAAPIFNVINIGANIAGVFPEPVVFATAAAVQTVNSVGKELNERWRANKFLEEANRDLFMPRKLYAVIVTWMKGGDPDKISSETVDVGAAALAKYGASQYIGIEPDPGTSQTEILKARAQRLRITSADTAEYQMPMLCAELVYPALDATQDASEAKKGDIPRNIMEQMKTKSKNTGKFVNGYFDRRAQATYAAANPNATLTAQGSPVEFKSRYADPENHTNKHFFTLITGGRYKAEPLGAKRRWEKAQRKAAEKRAQGLRDKPKKRRLGENVLYLAIVNLPDEAQIEAARKKIAEAKEKKGAGSAARSQENEKTPPIEPKQG